MAVIVQKFLKLVAEHLNRGLRQIGKGVINVVLADAVNDILVLLPIYNVPHRITSAVFLPTRGAPDRFCVLQRTRPGGFRLRLRRWGCLCTSPRLLLFRMFRGGHFVNPLRGVRGIGIPPHRIMGNRYILIGLLQNVLNQPLPKLGQGMIGVVQGRVILPDLVHHSGDLGVQFGLRTVIIGFPVAEIVIKTALLYCADQRGKGLPVQFDRTDRGGWGSLLLRHVLPVGSLKQMVTELLGRQQCVKIDIVKLRVCFSHGNHNAVHSGVELVPAVLLIAV